MSFTIDRASLLVHVPGAATLASVEEALAAARLTLGVRIPDALTTVASYLAAGAPGAPSSFADPADHLVAGLDAVFASGRRLVIRPSPRRAVGPDLVALFFGAHERFGTIENAWLRVHPAGVRRVSEDVTGLVLDAPLSPEENALLDAIAAELVAG